MGVVAAGRPHAAALLTRLLGRRRSWLLASQLVIAASLVGMAGTDPAETLHRMVWFALAVAFASATQDIALDAYRIEAVEQRLQGAMAATYQGGYRIAMIAASAGVLWLAAAVDLTDLAYEHAPWRFAYLVMAACMSVGIVTTLLIREPEVRLSEETMRARGACAGLAGRRRAARAVAAAGRLAAWCGHVAVARFHPALSLACGAAACADRHLPHFRRGHGHHGQRLLCRHGLHEGRGGDGRQGVRRWHDHRRCADRRRADGAHRRDEDAVPRCAAVVGHQPAVRLARRVAGTTSADSFSRSRPTTCRPASPHPPSWPIFRG
jgi:hypothetical protein